MESEIIEIETNYTFLETDGIMYHNHQKCLKLRIEGAFEAT